MKAQRVPVFPRIENAQFGTQIKITLIECGNCDSIYENALEQNVLDVDQFGIAFFNKLKFTKHSPTSLKFKIPKSFCLLISSGSEVLELSPSFTIIAKKKKEKGKFLNIILIIIRDTRT